MSQNRSRLVRIAVALSAAALTLSVQTGSGIAAKVHHHANRPTHTGVRRRAHSNNPLPPEGIFDSCQLSTSLSTCEQDLLQMHQAGFQVAVTSAQWASLDTLSTYASYAQSIGMSVMWELNDPGFWGGAWIGSSAAGDWPGFSSACGCTDTAQVLGYMIHWLSALPSTYGYYAADDWTLTRSQVGGLTQYVNEIKAADPTHLVMVGSTQGDGTTYYASGATMGNEIYPETTQSLMPYGRNLATWDAVQQSITQDQRAATTAGTSSAFILQAFTFGDNIWDGEAVGVCTPQMTAAQCASRLQYPSASVQLRLRNEVLQYAHPSLILWYTFSEASQGSRWSALSSVLSAPYPAAASAARAKRVRKAKARNRRRVHRRSSVRVHRRGPAPKVHGLSAQA